MRISTKVSLSQKQTSLALADQSDENLSLINIPNKNYTFTTSRKLPLYDIFPKA
ncbi:MAG: hypothetical protein MK132_07425 [Lentisphaerales bacterium]|nr:hypothetical protein [Lentisphaerales bacterium]